MKSRLKEITIIKGADRNEEIKIPGMSPAEFGSYVILLIGDNQERFVHCYVPQIRRLKSFHTLAFSCPWGKKFL